MKLNHTALCAVGQALYGNQWQQALADDLSVNVRTVRRWGKDEYPIPDGIWHELRIALQDRCMKLETLARQLPAA